MATDENGHPITHTSSSSFHESLFLYYALLFISLFLFDRLHRAWRHIYNLRNVDNSTQTHARLFNWVFRQFRVSEDTILDQCGLDTLTFFRFLQVGKKFSLLVIFLSLGLLPLYTTEDEGSLQDWFYHVHKITISNVDVNDDRLWAPVVASYVFCGYMMYLLWKEFTAYVHYRHKVLSSLTSPQYSILVSDLPVNLLSNQSLRRYMEGLFPGSVKEVNVSVECPNLQKTLEKRKKAQRELNYALSEHAESGRKPRHWVGGSWWNRCFGKKKPRGHYVDAIEHYQKKLRSLNETVAEETKCIERTEKMYESRLSRQLTAVISNHSDRPFQLLENDRVVVENAMQETDYEDPEEAKSEDTICIESQNDRTSTSNLHPDYGAIVQLKHVPQKSTIEYKAKCAAFVTFKSLMVSQILQQTVQSKLPARMTTVAAPSIDDVNWDNVGVRYPTRLLRQLFSSIVTAIIVLFWTIPTAFVTTLASVDSLRRALPFLGKALDKYPFLNSFCEGLSPLALVLLNNFATVIFGFLSQREGHPSNTQVQASMFTKLAYFQLIQVFFVTVVIGTVLSSLEQILNSPANLIVMLGRNMPNQSAFFSSYLLVLMGLNLPLELFRVLPLLRSALYHLLAPNSVKRNGEAPWCGLAPHTYLEPFDPTRVLADCFLAMLVSMTFAAIAPFVCLVSWFFFIFADLVYRRNAFHVYASSWFAMGAYWPCLFRFMVVSLVVSQLTMLGLLLIKKAAIPFAFIVILLLIILMYYHYIMLLYGPLAMHLPLPECLRLDQERDKRNDYEFLSNVYSPPLLNQKKDIHSEEKDIASL